MQVNTWMRVLWEGVETSIATADQQDADDLAAVDQRIRGTYSSGYFGKWYELNRQSLNPSTVRYIDNLLAQPG